MRTVRKHFQYVCRCPGKGKDKNISQIRQAAAEGFGALFEKGREGFYRMTMKRIFFLLTACLLLGTGSCSAQRPAAAGPQDRQAQDAHFFPQEQHHTRGDRKRNDRDRERKRRSRYVVGRQEVFYDGKPVKGASARTFKVLHDGYAADAWNVYHDGIRIPEASVQSFTVLRDGYAKDHWNVWYRGIRIKEASASSFRCLKDGYAEDRWNTYRHGQRIGR